MGHASSAMSANHKKVGFAFFSCIDDAFQGVAYQHQGFDSQSAAPEFVSVVFELGPSLNFHQFLTAKQPRRDERATWRC
jgi:hypothetical protein